MAAQLLGDLFLNGIAAAPSGTARFYQVGTLTPVTVYSNDAATTAVTQPVNLDASGKSTVPIYLTVPCRMIVQTNAGATVLDVERVDGVRAEAAALANTSWPTSTSVNVALTALATSLGGTDGNFKASGTGSVNRAVQTKLSETVSVKDFGAKGDGVTDDTASLVAAITYAASTSGGTIKIPSGTYLLSQTLVISTSNITIVGDGRTASVIQNTSATADAISLAGTSVIAFRSFGIGNQSTSTGNGVSITGTCDAIVFDGLGISGHRTGISQPSGTINNTNGGIALRDCNILCDSNAAATCVSLTNCNQGASHGGTLNTGTSFVGTVINMAVGVWQGYGGLYRGNVGVLSATSGAFRLYGVNILANTSIYSISGTASSYIIGGGNFAVPGANTARTIFVNPPTGNWGDSAPQSTQAVSSTSAVTPDNSQFGTVIYNATAAAITVTVNLPLITASAAGVGAKFTLIFQNNSGGAVTWTLNAGYKAAAIAPATGFQTGIVIEWNGTNWIEFARSGTVPT